MKSFKYFNWLYIIIFLFTLSIDSFAGQLDSAQDKQTTTEENIPQLYLRRCSTCHGKSGEGKKALAPSLKNNEFIGRATTDEIKDIILNGRFENAKRYKDYPSAMPASKGSLNDEQINELTKYLQAFNHTLESSGRIKEKQSNRLDSTQDIQQNKAATASKNIDISVDYVEPEIFPVAANLVNTIELLKNSGMVAWRIHNKSNEATKLTVISEIPEWAPPMKNVIDLQPYESKTIKQTPFSKKILRNYALTPATIMLTARAGDNAIYEETKSIKIRPVDDIMWSYKKKYDLAPLIAAWITPKEPLIEKILSRAKEKIFSRALNGYQSHDITEQVRAIFNAVRDEGISYVNSPINFGIGHTQRVRFPRQSIVDKSANCIDGAVLLASLFENIGLEPLIVFVPGHAFVGVKLKPGGDTAIFIETTLLGRRQIESLLTGETTFDAAVRIANEKFNAAKSQDKLMELDIKRVRQIGIYPLW